MTTSATDDWTPTEVVRPLIGMPRLARTPAVNTLAERLEKRGFSPEVASTIANAVVDPADARSRLQHPTAVRVPGGTMWTLDCSLWVPALIPYPVNNREAMDRHFPIGGGTATDEGAAFPPIREIRSHDPYPLLRFKAASAEHVVWSIDRSMTYLQGNNPWNDSIAQQGIMVPIIAALAEISHEDETPPSTVLTTPDGSSRTASALTILDLSPEEILYDFNQEPRHLRQFISETQAVLDRPADEASGPEIERIRALQVPARLILEFEPDVSGVGFATAVDSLVHLVHVEPQKPWDEAAEYDAKAEAVLGEMLDVDLISEERRDYLAGMMTPDEAEEEGYPVEEDERAATLLRVFRAGKFHDAVRRGIRVLSPNKYARKEEKVRIATELALRARRANLSSSEARVSRNTLRSAYLDEEIYGGNWSVSEDELGSIRRAALKELKDGGPGPKARELAVLGLYWLAIHGQLRDAHFFPEKSKRDGRPPRRIVGEMLKRPWGVQTLYRAAVDGRAGTVPRRVDDSGRLIRNTAGEPLEIDNIWLRGQVVPEGAPIDEAGSGETPTAKLRSWMSAITSQVELLMDMHADLREVRGRNGQVLIDDEGWDERQTSRLRALLGDLLTRLTIYGHTWSQRHDDESEDD